MTRAELDKRPADVATMFDSIADRYDLANDVLSLWQDRLWRRATVRAVEAYSGELVLDLAAGTGTSSESFTGKGARVIACDFSQGMLRVGAERLGGASRRGVTFVAGDALALPFNDETFDAVTVSFGLRNVYDLDQALRELRRVTKVGGRLVICEFNHIPFRPLDKIYTTYLMAALPHVARVITSDSSAYEYLSESIMAWPDQQALAARIQEAGWDRVAWRNLTFGVVALHRGFRTK
ncbi:demethylmenaquinone methyltransferase [Streptomonospora nanhaiensis]|uniref:Demethylmenaquinone methyltransferase n=1 Tax=Streptomonospora nanhaiensis TaxID=1323731 RepID=A0A853BPP0_9ACTN|nr:demethylmenaquinone methyltransferase [Streptomonospora nanhaiensis]MBV2361790.1 demethylmenaquinone methyltransferase [Streptomonospora nanhaiensis]MBX9387998.1 demethylmenaquinone methyltransferase [Streptomonospora nanhaiensis]NYI96392.1 demethylmenaquinone methyltransferase/2-methoxy-6-polyprenyl-1,4-benzoquinol methylase [Streptomonospora nanhaiensis]